MKKELLILTVTCFLLMSSIAFASTHPAQNQMMSQQNYQQQQQQYSAYIGSNGHNGNYSYGMSAQANSGSTSWWHSFTNFFSFHSGNGHGFFGGHRNGGHRGYGHRGGHM